MTHTLTLWSSNFTRRYSRRRGENCLKDSYTKVRGRIIHNRSMLEMPQMPISWQMGKQITVYLTNGILSTRESKGTSHWYNNTGKSQILSGAKEARFQNTWSACMKSQNRAKRIYRIEIRGDLRRWGRTGEKLTAHGQGRMFWKHALCFDESSGYMGVYTGQITELHAWSEFYFTANYSSGKWI